MIVFVDGTSLIPSHGSHTQNIPPITSVKESKANSAAGMFVDAIEYNINPRQTIVPWRANKASFLLDEKKLKSLLIITMDDINKQIKPANATVVNFGVSFFHLKLTEKTAKPTADANPSTSPITLFFSLFPNDIITIPMAAIPIAIQTLMDILSFKNKKPNNAVMKGIAARQRSVTAAVVLVIDQINVIIPVAKPHPPDRPEIPIFL